MSSDQNCVVQALVYEEMFIVNCVATDTLSLNRYVYDVKACAGLSIEMYFRMQTLQYGRRVSTLFFHRDGAQEQRE